MANKEKPRYDGTWRPEPGKTLPAIPEGVKPVLRFKNPIGGVVAWDDKVKGPHRDQQRRTRRPGDRTPRRHAHLQLLCGGGRHRHGQITHVIRGDDHVNNTPRQINIFKALGQRAAGVRPLAHRAQRAGREDEQAQRRQGRHGSTATKAICPTPWSTTWRVWAGATATTKFSAVRNFWSGSTWTTWAAAPRSLTKPNSSGSTPSTSRPCPTQSWLSIVQPFRWPKLGVLADERLVQHLRLVQRPLRHHWWFGPLGFSLLSGRGAQRRRKGAARD